jgi:hypothetical protein
MEDNQIKHTPKKYPKAIDGTQCIGECHKAREMILHPVTLEWIMDKHKSFCPINENENGEITKECTKITSDKSNVGTKNFNFDMLLPFVDLTPQRFLKVYYNIFSIDEMFTWLSEHSYLALDTRTRVVNNSLSAYGSDINTTNSMLTNFLFEIINTKWNKNIYEKIEKYISVDDKEKKIVFVNEPSTNKLKPDEYFEERNNFIFNKMLSHKNIEIFLNKIIKNKSEFKIQILQKKIIEYLIEKILLTKN